MTLALTPAFKPLFHELAEASPKRLVPFRGTTGLKAGGTDMAHLSLALRFSQGELITV